MTPIEIIKRETAAVFKLTRKDIEGPVRARWASKPRQTAMVLCRFYTRSSMPTIAKHFGGRHHTTLVHAEAVMPLHLADPVFARDVSRVCLRIEQRLYARRIAQLNRLAPIQATLFLAPPPPPKPVSPIHKGCETSRRVHLLPFYREAMVPA